MWQLRIKSKFEEEKEECETKMLSRGTVCDKPALISKTVYLEVNRLSLNAKMTAELLLSGPGFWDSLLMTLTGPSF